MRKAELLKKLKTNFNDSELRDVCLELEIDYENVPGMSKVDKARELILYLDRRKRLSELSRICQQLRPNVDWLFSDAALTNPDEISDSIEVQINSLSRRLNILLEIKARKGIDTEPHYLIEIEDIKKELNELIELRKNV